MSTESKGMSLLIKAVFRQMGSELETLLEKAKQGEDIDRYQIDPVFFTHMRNPNNGYVAPVAIRVPVSGVSGRNKGLYREQEPPDALYLIEDNRLKVVKL